MRASDNPVVNQSSLPAFLGIGAQKAATKWLYEMLRQHPDVWMPPLKELHFFNRIKSADLAMRERHSVLAKKHMQSMSDLTQRDKWKDYFKKVTSPKNISEEWYRDLFSWPVNANVVKGEITPAYLEIDEASIRYARELLGPAKIVVIVRRPLQRALSQLRMWAERSDEIESLAAGMPRAWKRIHRRMMHFEPRGHYSNIATWSDIFGAANMLAVPFSDVREDPAELMTRIEDYLGVSRLGEYAGLNEKVHTSKQLVIPEEIVAKITESVASEESFLKSYFGEAFFARTQ